MKIKKQIELFKKEFTHRDVIYLSIIGVTLLSLVTLSESNKHTSDWCDGFYNEFTKGL